MSFTRVVKDYQFYIGPPRVATASTSHSTCEKGPRSHSARTSATSARTVSQEAQPHRSIGDYQHELCRKAISLLQGSSPESECVFTSAKKELQNSDRLSVWPSLPIVGSNRNFECQVQAQLDRQLETARDSRRLFSATAKSDSFVMSLRQQGEGFKKHPPRSDDEISKRVLRECAKAITRLEQIAQLRVSDDVQAISCIDCVEFVDNFTTIYAPAVRKKILGKFYNEKMRPNTNYYSNGNRATIKFVNRKKQGKWRIL